MKRFSLLALIFLLCGCPRRAAAQVPVTLNAYQRQQFFDANGNPLAGGCVFTYQAGTTTPLATYTDSTGSAQNSNPVVLDSSGFGVLWLTANAYKFVLVSFGGVNCVSGAQQWTLDFVTPPPFLNGNNAWTGAETHSGTELFSAAVTLSGGGAMNGAFSGSPNFTGNPSFTGNPTFSNLQPFPTGISTDIINGINPATGFLVQGAQGTGATAGEFLNLQAGNGPAAGSANGGYVRVAAGAGGSTGGAGGALAFNAGNAQSGNGAGGAVSYTAGSGAGTGLGGVAQLVAGQGGSTAAAGGSAQVTGGAGGAGGVGGDVVLTPGAGSAAADGAVTIAQSGRLKLQNSATAVAPACASTGLGGGGTCVLANFSTDTSGLVTMTAAAGAAATGTLTLTFHATMGANGSFCLFAPVNGSGLWNAAVTVVGSSNASLTNLAIWTNAAVALTNGSTYQIGYWCRGAV